jgi:uncharacterized membrane protein YgcG
MRCPACRNEIHEGDAACTACGFTLAALDPHLGIPPQLTPPVVDMAQVLSSGARRTLAQATRHAEQHFPDLHAVVITAAVPAQFTPELYAFWLFNRTSLFSEVEKGGDNHGVLLLLDTQSARCAAMIGYGLEPLMPMPALETSLTAATPYLIKQNYASAGLAFFRELERQLELASETWPRAFGYSESMPWFDSSTGSLLTSTQSVSEDLY